MNVSLDDVRRELRGHTVSTVEEAGLKGFKNGDLLRAASGVFDALITVDQNLPHQQNIQSLPLAVIVIVANGITYEKLRPLLPDVLKALESIGPGEFIHVGAEG